ncbi:MAG: hypothetical protein QM831_16715 [Kofleriaceae bacterium]
MRRLKKTIAPRRLHADPTSEPDPGPAPESIFDRSTGPFSHRRSIAMPGAADEET